MGNSLYSLNERNDDFIILHQQSEAKAFPRGGPTLTSKGEIEGVCTGLDLTHFAAKAVLAGQKEKKVDKKESSNEQTTQGVQPRRESGNKTTNKKRTRKICSIASCTSQARGGGPCQRHGSKASLCKLEGCTNQVINGRVCIRHGAQVTPKIKGLRLRCSVETCTNFARNGGLCIRHGAAEQRK